MYIFLFFYHEALKACAVVRQLADPVEHEINDLLPNGLVPTCEVFRSILLA